MNTETNTTIGIRPTCYMFPRIQPIDE